MTDFDFLKKIPGGHESSFEANKNPPLRFELPQGTDVQEVIQGLKALNPAVQVDYSKGEGVLTVLMPPKIKVGTDPCDLREVAFVLKAQKDVEELKIPGEWEHCCANGGGCCANKG